MSEERCVCCGAVIPEGGHICPNCFDKVQDVYRGSVKDKGVEIMSVVGTISQVANWAENNIRSRGNCEIVIQRI